MSRIAREAETLMFSSTAGGPLDLVGGQLAGGRRAPVAREPERRRVGQVLPITDARGRGRQRRSAAACPRALLVVATHSGRTALALSKQRNATPTLALTDDLEAARAMALYWGVTALHVPELFETGQVLAFADEWCRARDLIDSGDRVVIVRGVIPNNPNHNALLVHEVE